MNYRFACFGLLALLGGWASSFAAEPVESVSPATKPEPLENEYPLDTFTLVGATVAHDLRFNELGWNEAQVAAFITGMHSGLLGGRPPMTDSAKRLMSEMARKIQEISARDRPPMADQAAAVEKYMKEVRKQHSLDQTDSGMCYRLQSAGTGIRPGPDDTVLISLKCMAPDGTTKLDALSVDHQRVKIAEMIPGLAEGFQMLDTGGTASFVVPPSLSYGDGEWPAGVPRGAPLIFTATLHEVHPGTAP